MKREKFRGRAVLIMLLCLFLASNLAAQSPGSQEKRISFRCEKEKLHKALDEVERLSGYYRMQYVMEDVAPYTVSVNLQNETVGSVVAQLLKGTSLKYEINGRFVQVFHPEAASRKNGKSDGKTIRGHVYDEEGEPLIGVTVRNKNTKEGTVTDLNGEFSLPARGGGKCKPVVLLCW